MALYKPVEKKLYRDEEGILQIETQEEANKRVRQEAISRENKQIKRIMNKGFTKNQAKYLRELELKIDSVGNVII